MKRLKSTTHHTFRDTNGSLEVRNDRFAGKQVERSVVDQQLIVCMDKDFAIRKLHSVSEAAHAVSVAAGVDRRLQHSKRASGAVKGVN
jgi:hypothetical protein